MLGRAKRCRLPSALSQIHIARLGSLGTRSIHPNGPITQFPLPKSKFDILFWGRDEFSCIALQRLYEANHLWNTLAVVTTPDTLVTRRGSIVVESPLKLLAEKLGLRFYFTPKEPRDTKSMTFDPPLHPQPNHPCPFSDQALLVVASFGQYIPNKILKCFWPGRKLNIHPSLLPKYRGPAPIQWAIADGLEETGVSIMEVERVGRGYDVGDIWDQRHVPIPSGATYDSLAPVLAKEGSQLLVEVMERILAGTQLPSTEQVIEEATEAPACGPETTLIDWETWDAVKVERMGRAFQRNRPLSSDAFDGAERVQLFDVTVLPPSDLNPFLDAQKPGLALFNKKRGAGTLDIQCANGSQIAVGCVKQRNKNRIPAKEWWNGVWPSRREGGFVRLNLVTEGRKVDAARGT